VVYLFWFRIVSGHRLHFLCAGRWILLQAACRQSVSSSRYGSMCVGLGENQCRHVYVGWQLVYYLRDCLWL
jgi:hypothetical protein